MESFLSRYKNPLVLLVVLLAQIIGLAVQVRRPSPQAGDAAGVRLIRYWALAVVGAPENWVHSAGLGVRGVWNGYVDLIHTRRQNRQLTDEIDRLRLEEANLAEDARQAQRLQALLGFREKYIYKTVPAQVIGASGSEQSHLLILDKGSADGLKRDMPVITPDGIVGRLRDVFPHKSQLLLISDATSGAGVILQTTRIRGVLRGNAYGQPEIINLLPDERIKPGEPVLTSGGDQIFPRGLAVGTVDRVVRDSDGDPLVDVLIHPAANLSRLEEVLVITNTGDQEPASEVHDVAQGELDAEQQKASDILAERLPSRIDLTAPPEEQLTFAVSPTAPDDDGPPIKPQLAVHPDQFTPDATPPATAMTPGTLDGPVLNGTEELAKPLQVNPPPTAGASAAPGAGQTAAGASKSPSAVKAGTGKAAASAVRSPAQPRTTAQPKAATQPGTAQSKAAQSKGIDKTGKPKAPHAAPAVKSAVSPQGDH
jgi:rod shape-determining protein MreC